MRKPSIRVDGANRTDTSKVERVIARFSKFKREIPFEEPKINILQPEPKTLTQRRKAEAAKKKTDAAKKAKAKPITAAPKTWDDKVVIDGIIHVVKRTSTLKRIMSDLGLSEGSWLYAFQKDFETVHAGIQSVSLEVAVQGGEAPSIPLIRMQAQERLKRCEAKLGVQSFEIALSIVYDSMTTPQYAKTMCVSRSVARDRMITAMHGVQDYYEKTSTRPSRSSLSNVNTIREFGRSIK